MSSNMYGVCCVCLVQSPVKLTPFFVINGKHWESTGLLDMLENVLGKKVIRQNESLLTVCNNCIKNIILSFNDEETTFSAEQKEKSELGKLQLEQPENEDLINMLDLTCLAKIFMYLPLKERLIMEEVCTKWRDATDFCWSDVKKFNVSCRHESLSQDKIRKIIRRCGYYLECLHLTTQFDKSILHTVQKHCQRLRKLCIYLSPWMNGHETKNLFSKMDKLKSIEIWFDPDLDGEETIHCHKSLTNILSSVPEDIEKLCFFGRFSHLNFPATLDKFNALGELEICAFVLNENIMREISEKKTLKKLSLKRCLCLPAALLNSDLPNLQELDLSYTVNKSCRTLSSLIKNCRNLRKINLDSSGNLISLGDISSLQKLEFLNLSFVPSIRDAEFAEITASCKNLVALNLTYSGLSSLSLRHVANSYNLEELDLSCLRSVDDAVMTSIASNLNKIRILKLCGCVGISSLGLKKIGYLVNLEGLDLPCISNFDSDVISSIANHCKKLQILNLCSTKNISKKDLEIVLNLENLKDLDLGGVETVDDEIIHKIADNRQKIEKLHISGCTAVSPEAIQRLIGKCLNLTRITVWSIRLNVETFKFAVNVTKCRTNNIILTIVADKKMIKCFYKPLKEKSRLLEVTHLEQFEQK